MSSSWNRWRRELTLLAVVLLVAACGGHAQPRVVGHYLVYGRETAGEPPIVLARVDGSGAHTIAHGQDAVLSPDGRWVAFDVEGTSVQEGRSARINRSARPRDRDRPGFGD